MGNCQGAQTDKTFIKEGDMNEIVTPRSVSYPHEQEIRREDLSDIIEQLQTMEDMTESLATERHDLASSLNEFSIQCAQNSRDIKLEAPVSPNCNDPSLKLNKLIQLPEKQLEANQEQLLRADLKFQEILQKNGALKKKKQIQKISQYQKEYFEEGETNYHNMQYKPVTVYSRLINLDNVVDDDEQQISYPPNSGRRQFVEDQYSSTPKRFNNDHFFSGYENFVVDEVINESESDGNYEGSEEENVKAKEKLIDNLFSDRARNKQLSIINDEGSSAERTPFSKLSQQFFESNNVLKKKDSVEVRQRNTTKMKKFPTMVIQGCRFQGETINKQRYGVGRQVYLDGTIFMGEWKKDKRDGKGVQVWPDSTIYEGEWQEDKIQGIGKIEYSNRSYYIGEWKENKFDGKGRFQHFSGSYYEGFWSQDQQNGKGVEVQLFPTYSRYEGIFEMGKKQGKGRLIMGNGSSYKGDFNNNNVHGLGVYNWSNGVKYEGRWENSKMSGSGKMTWPNNIVYQGEFKNDQKQGIGFIEYEDGSKFIGEWKQDKQHGNGTFYFKKNNSYIKGIWNSGKLLKVTSFYSPKLGAQTIFSNNNQNNKEALNNFNHPNIPQIPHNMMKSFNSPKNSIEIPDFGSQRSINMLDSKPQPVPKKSKHKLTETLTKQVSLNSKAMHTLSMYGLNDQK